MYVKMNNQLTFSSGNVKHWEHKGQIIFYRKYVRFLRKFCEEYDVDE